MLQLPQVIAWKGFQVLGEEEGTRQIRTDNLSSGDQLNVPETRTDAASRQNSAWRERCTDLQRARFKNPAEYWSAHACEAASQSWPCLSRGGLHAEWYEWVRSPNLEPLWWALFTPELPPARLKCCGNSTKHFHLPFAQSGLYPSPWTGLIPNKHLKCQTSSWDMLPEEPTCDRRRQL